MLVEPKGFRRSPLLEDSKTRYFVITSNVGENVVKSVQHSVWATQRKNEQKLNDAYRSSTAVILVFSVNRSGAFQGYARMRSMTGRAVCRSDPFSGFGRLFNVEWLRLHDIDVAEVNHLRNPLDDSRQVGFSRDGQELAHDVGAELCRHFDIQIFREDPESYEPVLDAQPRMELPPASAPPQQQPLLALPAPGAATPQGLAEALPTAAVGAPGGCAAPPSGLLQPSGPLQPNGPLQPAGHMPPPFAVPGPYGHPVAPPMHYPPGYGFHPYGPPPWAAPPALLVGGDPRRGRHRGRRRRRSASYSSYDSEASAPKKSHKKKRKKDKKRRREGSRREKPPDFENMSYEEYMEWWRKKHLAGTPFAAGQPGLGAGPAGPAPPAAAAQAPAPAAAAAAPQAAASATDGRTPAEAPEEEEADGKARGKAIPPPASLAPGRPVVRLAASTAAQAGPEGNPPLGVWAEGGAGRATEEAASSTPSAASDLPEGEVAGTSPVPEGVYQ